MTETEPGRFVEKLRALRVRSGNPSLNDLVGRHGIGYARSTVSGHLSGRRLPPWEFVEALVRACGRASGVPQENLDLDGWRAAHRVAAGIVSADPPAGEFAGIRAAYQERLRRRYGHAEMATLAPAGDLDQHELIPLRDIFVPPEVRPDPPPVELPRELLRRLTARGEIREGDLPPGLGTGTLQRIRRAYRAQPPRPVPWVLGAEADRGLVLLGDPGSGKSTVARYLALSLAADQVEPGLESLAGALPILVELRTYAVGRSRAGSLTGLIESQAEGGGHGLRRAVLEGYLRAGHRAVVIFDGLDEIFDPRVRDEVAEEIGGFAARFPSARVVVTSRVIGYRRAIFDREGFRTYQLQDFDRSRIEKFLTIWYGRLARPDRTGHLLAALDESPAVAELAGNPLLLTIMAWLGRDRDLPRDRRDVYQHAVGVLVTQWDPSRHLHDDRHTPEHTHLGEHDRLELLRRVARRIRHSPGGLAGNHLIDRDLIDEVAGYLRDEHDLPNGRAKAVARAIVDEFRTRNFILSHFGSHVYGFVHRAFLEHLTAADIAEGGEIDTVADRHWPDPAWEETLVLLAGMVEPDHAARIIDRLLTADTLWFLGPRDIAGDVSPLHEAPRGIVLAIRCLGELRDPGLHPQLCERVVTAVFALLEHIVDERASPTSPITRAVVERVAPVLERLGRFHPPARDRYRDWYLMRGRFLRIWREGESFMWSELPPAAQVAAGLLRDDARFRGFLLGQTLFGADEADREEALRTLIRQRPGDPEVAALLRRTAETDADGNVRGGSVRLFARAAKPEGEALDWVRARLTDDDVSLRRAASGVFALEWREHPEALAIVSHSARTDRDMGVRERAVTGLGEAWPGDPRSGAVLREIAADDPEGVVRGAAADRLMRDWLTDPATVPVLRKVAADDDVRWWIREQAAKVLAPAEPEPPRPAARQAESMRTISGRRAALEPFERTPQTAVRLRDRAASGEAGGRVAALRVLAAGWPDDPDLPAWLAGIATSDNPIPVREAALRCLAELLPGSSVTTEVLHRVASGTAGQGVRDTAAMLLAATAPADPRTAAVLLEAARNSPDRYTPVSMLSGLADETAAAVLWERAADGDRLALDAVLLTRHDDPAVAGLLRRAAEHDAEPWHRETRMRQLVLGWRDDPATLPLIRRLAASSSEEDDRAAAVRVLGGGWRDEPAVGELLRGFVAAGEEADPARWRAAVRALAGRWPYDKVIFDLAARVAEQEADDM
jgi:hypothetical protein